MAAKEMYTDHSAKMEYLTGLKDYLILRAVSYTHLAVYKRQAHVEAAKSIKSAAERIRHKYESIRDLEALFWI